MKKTFTINISGIIFHIDEDAFAKLSIYLETIKGYFTNSEGRDEIISDIESRIAEMLQAKITDNKQVITIEDVNEVITVMGEPEQIGEDNNTAAKNEHRYERKGRRRLFRDPDNKILGGVCGGIGAYFNLDPLWFRIAFVVALFIFGSGPLLYIILWLIIPEATTTAERLEMKGEPINVSNIEKTIHEELNNLKDRLKNIKEDARSAYKKNFRRQSNNAAEKVLDIFLLIGYYFIRAVAILIGIVFIMLGIFLLIGFLTSFFKTNDVIWISSIGVSNFSFIVFLKLFLGSSTLITLAMIGLSLLIGIPLIMLVYNGIKMIFGIKSRKRFIGISSFTLWFAGLIICLIVALTTLSSLSHKSVVTKNTTLEQPATGLLNIYIKNNNMVDSINNYESKLVIGQWNVVSHNNKNLRFGLPELKIVSSENQNFQIITYYSAKGNNKIDAEERIKKIEYRYNQNDTALFLDPYYIISDDENWRAQNVRLVIKVPLWKTIYLSPETAGLLDQEFESHEIVESLAGKKLIMTNNGLKEYIPYPVIIGKDTIQKSQPDTVGVKKETSDNYINVYDDRPPDRFFNLIF